MRTGKSLIGMAVVGAADGTQLGHVRDLIFDHDTDQLLALVMDEKDLFGLIDAMIVPWSQVQSMGSSVITARSASSKIKLHDDPSVSSAAHRETALSGTSILTEQGQHLGTLADACIDETTGQVLGYEVSGGFISDTLRGKKFLPAPPGLEVGKDAAIAPPAAAAQLNGEK